MIIFDPSWNPTTDNQSVDRAYRIGQTENVVIYRMITIGTVEEKTYRKQVFKQGIANDAQKGGGNEDFSPSEENNNEDEFRYFSSAETDGNIMFTFDAANSDDEYSQDAQQFTRATSGVRRTVETRVRVHKRIV